MLANPLQMAKIFAAEARMALASGNAPGRNEALGTGNKRCNSFAVDRAKRPVSTTFSKLRRKSSASGPSHGPLNQSRGSRLASGGLSSLPVQPKMKSADDLQRSTCS